MFVGMAESLRFDQRRRAEQVIHVAGLELKLLRHRHDVGVIPHPKSGFRVPILHFGIGLGDQGFHHLIAKASAAKLDLGLSAGDRGDRLRLRGRLSGADTLSSSPTTHLPPRRAIGDRNHADGLRHQRLLFEKLMDAIRHGRWRSCRASGTSVTDDDEAVAAGSTGRIGG